MRRSAFSFFCLLISIMTSLAAIVVPVPVQAQVRLEFGSPGGYYPDEPPPPRYRYRDPYERHFREDYHGGGYDSPVYGRRMGYICETSRGACEISRPAPLGASCRCHIPGFGRKRGNVR
jgi:hypothetical protein